MIDYNLGRVVGTDGTGIQSIVTFLEADGRRRVEITLTTGTVERFYIEKGTKGDTGTGIRTIELINTVGKDKNYRITFTDNSTFDYTITDGEDAVCDTELDIESKNAVQNKVITSTINTINTTMEEKYDKNDVLQLLIDYGLVRTADTADSVVLAGDKEILSYADEDILTLSATVYDEDNNVVPNKKVVFYKNEVVLDTRYTDANGVATYEYTSEGVGDVRFEASVGSLLSETYNVEDCIRVDDATSDKTSNYNYNNLDSFTHNTDHYEAVRPSGLSDDKYYSPIYADDTLPTNYEIRVDFKWNTSNAYQTMISIASSHPQTYQSTTEFGLISVIPRDCLFERNNGSANFASSTKAIGLNEWYTFILQVQGTSVFGKIVDSNDNVLYNQTRVYSMAQNHKKWSIICGQQGHTLEWKNLKIKPL